MNIYLCTFLLIFLSGAVSHSIEFAKGPNDVLDITSETEVSIRDPEQTDFKSFDYKPNSQVDLKLPYTSKAIWMRFRLENSSNVPLDQMLYLSSALTGNLILYKASSLDFIQKSGSSVPLKERVYAARLPVFPIHLNAGESEIFYLKRVSHHNLASKVFLSSQANFVTQEADSKAILFFYLGGILCLIVYNLFIGLYAKDLNYFFYAFFASSVAAASLNTQGFFDAYVVTDLPFTVSHYLMVFSSVGILASLIFVYRFLNIRIVLPEARLGFWILGGSGCLTLIYGLSRFGNLQLFFGHLVDLTIVSVLFYLIACGLVAYYRGYKLARFFLFSWVSLLFGVMAWFGMTYGVFHNTTFTSNSLLFGNMGEMLILSLGLAYKIAVLDQEKKQAEIEARDKDRYHRLVKVLSHDVANAIHIFSGYLFVLKRNLTGGSEMKTITKLENILENTKEMLGLVRQEEVFNSYRQSVTLRPVDLHEVAEDAVSFYEDRLKEKNLRVHIQIPEKSFVLADKTAVTNQIISNLLSNSVKFSHADSEILISVECLQSQLVLRIQDFGVGIVASDINRVFFTKEILSQSGTMHETGSGLGTSLVKDYMEIFNGKIEVKSTHQSASKHSGTTVSLYFPRI